MEQAAVVSYAVGYIAALIVAFLILLPVLIPILLLLVAAGVLQLLALGIQAVATGTYCYSAGLIRSLVHAVRKSRDGPRTRHGGRRLHSH
ncbi:hypothetical protein [Arthrobacter sp. B10-11]|uniref:hypothetical protein n=1 Tax=Arthrobacter sp. B10-11 TaxID=3081160 RepID=UPI0029535E06|nr:hypothetical protein [Arthrobacter sp. B10-11]MDV8149122.1 hypothetical protein [Arthrobacter sp. B10-11]